MNPDIRDYLIRLVRPRAEYYSAGDIEKDALAWLLDDEVRYPTASEVREQMLLDRYQT